MQKKGMYLKCTNMYIEIEEYKEAMHYAQQYVKTAPKDYKGYKLLGFLHEKLGSVKEALKAYRRWTVKTLCIVMLLSWLTANLANHKYSDTMAI